MMISGNRRIPLVYSNEKAKDPIYMTYVPASSRTIRFGCVCPPPPPVNVVGVGTGANTLLYSRDGGITWTGLGNTIFTTEGNCADWNGTMWVAGGRGTNALAYSYDGISWTGLGEISTGISSTMISCTSVVWSGTLWVAVDGSGNVAISSDGINWSGTSGTTGGTYPAYIATNGSRFVAIPDSTISGTYNPMSTSTDGVTWTALYDTPLTNEQIASHADILWDGSKFILVVNQRDNPINSKFYSADGISWTGIPNVGYVNGTNIGKTTGNLYISRGTDPNSTEKSTNGTSWTTVTNPSLPIVRGVPGTIFGTNTNIFVCGFNSNSFIYSTDGINWTSSSTGLSGNFKAGFFKA